MRSTRKPRSSLERFLVLVLVGFITIDLLLVVPAYASELRLDRLHPSLPIVNLRPLAQGRARITKALGEDFTAPIRALAGNLKQAGAQALNASLLSPTVDSLETAVVQTATALGQPTETRILAATSTQISSYTPTSPSTVDTLETAVVQTATALALPSGTKIPAATSTSPSTVDILETSVVQTATALALPSETKIPAATSTQIPSYTPTSTSVQTQQTPSMTPSQVAIATATVVCTAIPITACTYTPNPTSTPAAIATSTPLPTATAGSAAPLPAFPGAEGWGAQSLGGRGGKIIEVTNLNNSGPGSLRRCAQESSGPRICVFKVAGEIVLRKSRLAIRNPYLTIAGQTAPGDGITLRAEDDLVRPIINFEDGVHDVVIRYLTVRGGKGSGQRDGLTFRGGHNIILDHLTVEWATDEIVGINPNVGETVSNITIQRSILAEAFRPHSTGILLSGEDDLSQITLHHNLFAHNAHRNPRVGSSQRVEFINNVVYNWHSRAGTTKGDAEVDFVGNYFKAGPWSDEEDVILHDHVHPSTPDVEFPDPSIYAQNNLAMPFQPDPGADNWNLFQYHYALKGPLPTDWRRFTSIPSPVPVTVDSAQAAYDSVLADVGDNARLDRLGNWVPKLDIIDRNIISDVIKGTGPSEDSEIDHQDDFGGYPAIDPGTPYDDSDHDGMADAWELVFCFNPNDPSDGPADADGDGYANVEEFLNGTQPTGGGACSG